MAVQAPSVRMLSILVRHQRDLVQAVANVGQHLAQRCFHVDQEQQFIELAYVRDVDVDDQSIARNFRKTRVGSP